MGIRSGQVRVVAVAAAVALVASACGILGPGGWFPGHGPALPSGVHVISPANRSQADPSGNVPVQITLAARLDPSTLRVSLISGWPIPTAPPLDISSRLVISGQSATAQLTASDLRQGITTVRAQAAVRGSPNRVELGFSSFSWEPNVDLSNAATCDFLDTARCLLPFPNDYYTVRDRSSVTGRRVNIQTSAMPANAQGVHVDATEWDRNDGFSPGAMILTYVPGLDLAKTGAAPITNIGSSLDPNQPIVLLDAQTGQRQPFFAELDAQADPTEGAALIIRPARNLAEGHTFIVALRNMRDASGSVIPAARAFTIYRDGIPTFSPVIEARRPQMEGIFRTLARAGVGRGDLYLAWDFTVASAKSIAGRSLHIRDDAFAALGGHAPAFQVTQVQDDVDSNVFRRVTGTFSVPLYLTQGGVPGSQFQYASATPGMYDVPVRTGTYQASFICNIPWAATTKGAGPVHPARAGVYGHGLLGSNDEVDARDVETVSNTYDFVFCATKWIGFSDEDVGNAVKTLQDFSNFPTMADRTQQGFLDTLVLARLMRAPDGLVTNPAFEVGSSPVIDTSDVFYYGNSQGGILGGATTALSNQWTRAVLGVPGMNYSTLLQRSVDFDTYKLVLDPAYPSELDRLIALSAVQMLWDRADADGFAEHMTSNPYPNTPAHTVLLEEAFGDHQVANVTTEVEARTIGAFVHQPALAPGRSTDVVPFWGIPAIPSYPFGGSALFVWDSGTPAPPITNTPPEPPQYGSDPHGVPRNTPAEQQQLSDFLRTGGTVVDTCGGAPCIGTG